MRNKNDNKRLIPNMFVKLYHKYFFFVFICMTVISSCNVNINLKYDVMKINNRMFDIFYHNEPKVWTQQRAEKLDISEINVRGLMYSFFISVSKKHNETEEFIYSRYKPVYIEHDKKNSRLIIYFEIKQEFMSAKYELFKQTGLFPNNILIINFIK